MNYLLPRKVAIEATSGNLKQLEQRRHNIQKREEQRIGDAGSLRSALDGESVTIVAKVGEEGRLFGSVTSHMIEEAVREQLGTEVDRRKIDTHGHIKEVGPHVVDVTVYRDIKAQLTVEVVGEGFVPEATQVEVEPETVAEETAAEAADEAADAEVTEDLEPAESADTPEAAEAEEEAAE